MPQELNKVKITAKALIALGSNATSQFGPPENSLFSALKLIDECTNLIAVSRFFETPCFPAGAGPDFVNAAAMLETSLKPRALLSRLHGIERDFGRERAERWGQRTLDIDLIAFGDLVLPDLKTFTRWQALPLARQKTEAPDDLILPHPRLQDRGFVLIPLADIVPDWRHPVTGETVSDMVSALPDSEKTGVRALPSVALPENALSTKISTPK